MTANNIPSEPTNAFLCPYTGQEAIALGLCKDTTSAAVAETLEGSAETSISGKCKAPFDEENARLNAKSL